VDSGVVEGAEVSVHYDSLLAKLIARGDTRDAARRRARQALEGFPILGIRTNVPLLIRLLAHERFIAGDLDTDFLATEAASLLPAPAEPPAEVLAVAETAAQTPAAAGRLPRPDDPWASLKGLRV
jgi:3-methylcrotonyl-CoA carboxylase alpha subunit